MWPRPGRQHPGHPRHTDLQFRVLTTPQQTPPPYPKYSFLEDIPLVENEISKFRDQFFIHFYPYYCLTRAVRFPLRHGVM